MKNKVIIFLLLAFSTMGVYGQKTLTEEHPDSIENQWDKVLDEVVVTGTRTPKLVTNSPILTRVISSSDIRKSDATNISDLLQTELPGIEFSYSMNQQVSLNMQGFGGNSVLFLVDGERLAGETLDNVDYDRLNLNNAGKIEIVKGAASSLYGSNAVGGVVNIISREASEPWTLNINGRYGKHNSQRYGAVFSVNKWKINSSTSAQFTSIDSYNMKNEGDYSTYYGNKTWNINERLTIKPINALKIIARAGYFFRERNSQVSTHDRYRDFSGGLRGVYEFSPGTNLELSYSFDQYDKSDYILLTRKDVRDYSNVQNIGKMVFNHTFGGNYILTVGGDVMRDYLMSYQFTDNGSHHQITADGFAQIDMTFNKLNVIAGGRYDYFSESDMKHFSSRVNMMY
ncbi:MAG: TonB-dependent receptor, partial [Bacteroidales bacterium]|nr:TonB-dependent receptor [Bacteroidales bacterium]